MRKILIVFMLSFLVTPPLYAIIEPMACMSVCMDNVISESCKKSCAECKLFDEISNKLTGIKTITRRDFNLSCPGGNVCSCKTLSTTYSCISGWYGTAVNSSSGCKVCPANATCNGGNGSVFVCKAGFYSDGNSCVDCATTGNTRATSAPGSVGITSCYVPAGATGSDASGSFEFTSDCNYSN